MQWIDYGLGGLDASAPDAVGGEVTDLADRYHELARRRALFGFAATKRFYEIGTPESLAEAGEFLMHHGPAGRRDHDHRSPGIDRDPPC